MANWTETQERMLGQEYEVRLAVVGLEPIRAAWTAGNVFETEAHRTIDRWGIGVRELVYDRNGRKWTFDPGYGIWYGGAACTIISPKLTGAKEDTNLLGNLVRRLLEMGARFYGRAGCGVHIYIESEYTPRTVRNLANIMAAHEELLRQSLTLSDWWSEKYGRAVDPHFVEALRSEKPDTMRKVKEIWDRTTNADEERSWMKLQDSCYTLNVEPVFYRGAAEFRYYRQSNPGSDLRPAAAGLWMETLIRLSLAIHQAAKDSSRTSPMPVQTDNPKYAMRTWLMKLGFVGDEFSLNRRKLLKNLPGNGANRGAEA